VTSQASGEEAVWANFYKDKGKDQTEPTDKGKDCTWWEKGKKNSWKHHDSEFVAVIDRVHKQKTGRSNPVTFEKIIKSPCHNHGYLVEHNLEDYGLIKCYLKGEYKASRTDKPAGSTGDVEKGDTFLDPKQYLMIFSGPAASEPRCR